ACGHSIVRSFVDRYHVIVAHGQEKRLELTIHVFEGFLCRIKTTRRILHFLHTLVGPICQHDVCGHSTPPSATRQCYLCPRREKHDPDEVRVVRFEHHAPHNPQTQNRRERDPI